MRFSFKKIAAIGASVLLAGMSMGFAAAAYPAPFVQSGAANVAIVYGDNAQTSDITAANSIASDLNSTLMSSSSSASSSSAPTGGVLLSAPSSYLHVGGYLNNVFDRAILKTDMPNLLADGTYRDYSQNTHDYTQKIQVANLSFNQFDLEQYNTNVTTSTPKIGLPISSGDNILNYTLTFQTPVNVSDMAFSNLPLLGKEYYVDSATTSQITLLDAGTGTQSLSSGGSATYTIGGKTYDVSATIYSNDKVVFTVGSQTTQQLNQGDTYQLTDGSYLGVQSVAAASYAGGPSTVQFSIGSGKIILNNASTVTVNSNSVSGLTSTFGLSGGKISNIQLSWDASDNTAVTPSHSISMPVFGNLELSTTGMTYPMTENTTVSNSGNTVVQLNTETVNGPINLQILKMNQTGGNFTSVGGGTTSTTLKTASGSSLKNVGLNNEFVVSWNNSKSSESDVFRVSGFGQTGVSPNQIYTVTLQPLDGSGNTVTLTNGTGQAIGAGNIVLTPTVDYSGKTVNLSASGGSGSVNFNVLYTKDGLKVLLPTDANYTGTGTKVVGGILNNGTTIQSYPIQFTEAAKDGTLGGGSAFNITVGHAGSSGAYSTSVTNVAGTFAGSQNNVQYGSTQLYRYVVSSPLASMIYYDQSPTQDTATVTYHGGESYGKVYLSPGATVSGGSGAQLGNVVLKASELPSTETKNLIVVGGSCVNSAAASLLGVAAGTCGSAWTAATGLGSGQFLIKSYGPGNQSLTSGVAVLVAGTDAADTTAAVSALMHQSPDVSAGKSYTGTISSSTLTTVQ